MQKTRIENLANAHWMNESSRPSPTKKEKKKTTTPKQSCVSLSQSSVEEFFVTAANASVLFDFEDTLLSVATVVGSDGCYSLL